MAYLIGIDIGTTAVKSVLFDDEGHLIRSSSREYQTMFLQEGYVEQDPEVLWHETLNTLKELTAESTQAERAVSAIAVSSQAPTLLPLDAAGQPIRNAVIWMDRRSDKQCNELRASIGQDTIFHITGNSPDPYYTLPKLLWYRENEKENFEKTASLLQINGYINFRLTGELSIDRSHAGLTELYDIRRQTWSETLFSALELSTDLFPPIRDPYAVIGRVKHALSEEIGFTKPPLVTAGTVDGTAAALESGTVSPGTVCEMTGTSTVLLSAVAGIATNPHLTFLAHAVNGINLLIGTMSSTGAGLKWFRDEMGLAECNAAKLLCRDPYQIMDEEVEGLPDGPSGLIYLPYLMGERSPIWNSAARAVFFGISAKTKRPHMIKAILEGAALGLLHNIEELRSSSIDISEIRSVGGGSRSAVWNQIKADVTGIPILLPNTATGAPFGDALIAGYAAGCFSDMREAADKQVTIKQTFAPDAHNTALYRELFEIYKDIYLSNRENFQKLQHIRTKLQ